MENTFIPQPSSSFTHTNPTPTAVTGTTTGDSLVPMDRSLVSTTRLGAASRVPMPFGTDQTLHPPANPPAFDPLNTGQGLGVAPPLGGQGGFSSAFGQHQPAVGAPSTLPANQAYITGAGAPNVPNQVAQTFAQAFPPPPSGWRTVWQMRDNTINVYNSAHVAPHQEHAPGRCCCPSCPNYARPHPHGL